MPDFVNGENVWIGLSGGVDSAVSAALLQSAGARVTGVFIKGWYPPGMPCTWAADRRDAMRVAAHLKIPFITLDASTEYKQSVIDYLLREYKAGRTPNPDVMCNRDIKFGIFYRFAKAQGATHIATGHYRGGDKDQSYFLWAVPKEVLAETVFPLGTMDKSEVRTIATRLGLPVAKKKDSQGVCFLGDVSVKDFLKHELGNNAAMLHTLGERAQGGYVVAKDIAKGQVTTEEKIAPRSTPIHFSRANWHTGPEDATSAQYRYRGTHVEGKVVGDMFVPNAEITELVAPGQSLVFYRENTLVGGAIIES